MLAAVFLTMQELVNHKMFNIKDRVVLDKFPQAAAFIVKLNITTITVELSSVDKTIDGRIFNVKPSEISQVFRNGMPTNCG